MKKQPACFFDTGALHLSCVFHEPDGARIATTAKMRNAGRSLNSGCARREYVFSETEEKPDQQDGQQMLPAAVVTILT